MGQLGDLDLSQQAIRHRFHSCWVGLEFNRWRESNPGQWRYGPALYQCAVPSLIYLCSGTGSTCRLEHQGLSLPFGCPHL